MMLTAVFLLAPFVAICVVLAVCGLIERWWTVTADNKKSASGSAKSKAA